MTYNDDKDDDEAMTPYVYVNGEPTPLLQDYRLALYHYAGEGAVLYDVNTHPHHVVPLCTRPGAECGVTRHKLLPYGHYCAYRHTGKSGGGGGSCDCARVVDDHAVRDKMSAHDGAAAGMTTTPPPAAARRLQLVAVPSRRWVCVYVMQLPRHTTPHMLGSFFERYDMVVEANIMPTVHERGGSVRGWVVLHDARKLLSVPRVLRFTTGHVIYTELSERLPEGSNHARVAALTSCCEATTTTTTTTTTAMAATVCSESDGNADVHASDNSSSSSHDNDVRQLSPMLLYTQNSSSSSSHLSILRSSLPPLMLLRERMLQASRQTQQGSAADAATLPTATAAAMYSSNSKHSNDNHVSSAPSVTATAAGSDTAHTARHVDVGAVVCAHGEHNNNDKLCSSSSNSQADAYTSNSSSILTRTTRAGSRSSRGGDDSTHTSSSSSNSSDSSSSSSCSSGSSNDNGDGSRVHGSANAHDNNSHGSITVMASRSPLPHADVDVPPRLQQQQQQRNNDDDVTVPASVRGDDEDDGARDVDAHA